MHLSCSPGKLLGFLAAALLSAQTPTNQNSTATAQSTQAQTRAASQPAPVAEKFDYMVEWHMITAGLVHMETTQQGSGWQTALTVQSAGTLTRLYRVDDKYRVQMDGKVCPSNTTFESQEGRKHNLTRMTFDANRHKVSYVSQDLVKNATLRDEIDVPPCTREIVTALTAVRSLHLEPGRSVNLAMTDGKRNVSARIEAQARETLTLNGKQWPTVRYEAFVFDNALFKRKGQLFIWISDDGEQLPVQLRFQMGFPIGNVSVVMQSHTRF